MVIDAITHGIETYLGNPVVQREYTEKYFGSTPIIRLDQYPVASVTSITDPASNTVDADDYKVIEDIGELRHVGGWNFPAALDSNGNLDRWEIVYTAGRFANTGAVDPDFKMAACEWAGMRYRRPGNVLTKKVGDLTITYKNQPEANTVPDVVQRLIGWAMSVRT
jgi:hypothetical protein